MVSSLLCIMSCALTLQELELWVLESDFDTIGSVNACGSKKVLAVISKCQARSTSLEWQS